MHELSRHDVFLQHFRYSNTLDDGMENRIGFAKCMYALEERHLEISYYLINEYCFGTMVVVKALIAKCTDFNPSVIEECRCNKLV